MKKKIQKNLKLCNNCPAKTTIWWVHHANAVKPTILKTIQAKICSISVNYIFLHTR